jgi:hypothetical protein
VDRPAARRRDGEPAPTSEIEHLPLGGLELDLGQNAGQSTNTSRKAGGIGAADIERMLGPMTMFGHAPRLDQVAVNVTCGLVPG